MITELYRNCELVQINVKTGVEDYFFPKNVAWVNRCVDKLLLCAPKNACVSPIDGVTPVITYTQAQALNIYIDLYAENNRAICQSMDISNIIYTNNYPVRIDSVLSLNLSQIHLATKPVSDGCLLFYIFYDTKMEEYYEPSNINVTRELTLAPNEKLLVKDMLLRFPTFPANDIRGIQIWTAEDAPVYLTLRDRALTYNIKDVHSAMFRPQMAANSPEATQVHPFLTDSIDIDFDYSFIRNANGNTNTIKVTFEY